MTACSYPYDRNMTVLDISNVKNPSELDMTFQVKEWCNHLDKESHSSRMYPYTHTLTLKYDSMYQHVPGRCHLYTEPAESVTPINAAGDGSFHQCFVSYIDDINPKITWTWQVGDSPSNSSQKGEPVPANNVPKASMSFHETLGLYKQSLWTCTFVTWS